MNRIKKSEVINTIIVILFLIFGIGTDTVLNEFIPVSITLKTNDIEGLSWVLFQVHSTVSTLGIALIAILSSSNNELIYGVSVSRFILQIRPRVLKHKNVLITILLFVLLNYIFISFHLINSMISLLFTTIYLIIYLLTEIFIVFDGREKHKMEIGKYIKEYALDIDIINELINDTLVSIERSETIRFSENAKLIVELIGENSHDIEKKSEYKKCWEEYVKELFKKLFSKHKKISLNTTYEFLNRIYVTLIDNFEKPEEFILWDNISYDFFASMNRYQVNTDEDIYPFTYLRFILYKTLSVSREGGVFKRNNYSVEYLFPRLYWFLFKSNSPLVHVPVNEISERKVMFYETITRDISYRDNSPKDILIQELLLYTKAIIESIEINVLEKTLGKLISRYNNTLGDDVFENYILVVVIYMYYLSEKEKLVDDKLRNSTTQFCAENVGNISNFIYMNHFEKEVTKDDIQFIKHTLKRWEYIPEDAGKFMIMDSCVDSFLIMSAMYSEKRTDLLKKRVEPLIVGNSFTFVNSYTGDNTGKLKDEYSNFVKLFFGKEVTEEEAVNDAMRFESVVLAIYKMEELKKGYEKVLSNEKLLEIQESLTERIKALIETDMLVFRDTVSGDEFKDGLFEFGINTYSGFLESNYESDASRVRRFFVRDFLRLLISEDQINYKEINFRNKNTLSEFFNLVEQTPFELNTLVGYRDWFYGYERDSEFKEIEGNSNKIHVPEISDIVSYIACERLAIEVENVNVRIEDLDIEAFKSKLDKDEGGNYLYNITNNIFLPFKESELEELIKHTRKRISIDIPYRYSFSDKSVGIAIIHKK